MSLHRKTMTIIGTTLLLLILLLYSLTHNILMGRFIQLEEQNSRRNAERVLSALSNKLNALDTIVGDWSGWDDTYNFMEDVNQKYIESNLADTTFIQQKTNLILFVNTSGKIIFGKAYDLQEKKEMSIPQDFLKALQEKSILLQHPTTDSCVKGILLLPEGPMLITSRPILTSQYKGPIRGFLIMGRYLKYNQINELAQITHLSLNVKQVKDSQLPSDFKTALLFLSPQKNIFIKRMNKDTIVTYTLFSDIYGKPALIIRIDQPREIFKQWQASMLYFILSLLLTGLVFGVITLFLLKKVVLSRLSHLSSSVSSIGIRSDLSARLSVEGNDELSGLTENINEMLEALEQSQKEIKESEERYRTIFETTGTSTMIVEEDGTLSLVNTIFEQVTGYSKEEVEGKKSWTEFVVPENQKKMQEYLHMRRIDPQVAPKNHEFRILDKSGNVRDALVTVSMIPGTSKSVASALDITELKQVEEQLKYFSRHDSLTGLYNRAYFEQEMLRLMNSRHTSAGIILCDVDGLKLVNDTLGHAQGDCMIIAAATLIKQSLAENDFVARIGGDEFAILLADKDVSEIENCCRKIRDSVSMYTRENTNFPLSISIGFAICSGTSIDMIELFKEADNNMYREKLHHNQSRRSTIIQTLMKALQVRDFITEGHTDRMQNLVENTAVALGLPEHRITDLRLLGRFHDIGKVGISDNILFKNGPLTQEETIEMRRHSEIGYRIAQTSPDLMPIADWILKHHEWWNGSGYPFGLKGEEIPLECRILAIADAYDAIINNRPYHKALTHEQAITELKKLAGIQFDPYLVQRFIEVLDSRPQQE